MRRDFRWSSDKRSATPVVMGSFLTGEPNNAFGNEHCTIIIDNSGAAALNDRSCGEDFTTICQYHKECPPGHSAFGGSACTKCPAGTFQDGTIGERGQFACRPCPVGRYGSVVGETSGQCQGACAAGYKCPAGSTSPNAVLDHSLTTPSHCPNSYVSTSLGCIVLLDHSETWWDAKGFCELAGGKLAEFEDQTTLDQLYAACPSTDCWLGGNDLSTEG